MITAITVYLWSKITPDKEKYSEKVEFIAAMIILISFMFAVAQDVLIISILKR
jgi:hypothetical protein